MITGLVHVAHPVSPEAIDALADTLASLVAGVAAGLVGDAIIIADDARQDLEVIADGLGAEFVVAPPGEDPWFAAARTARREWLLCLEAGDILREGWIRTTDRFIGTARSDWVLARLRRPHTNWSRGVLKRSERFIGARRADAGDLLRRDTLIRGPTFSSRLVPHMLNGWIDRTRY